MNTQTMNTQCPICDAESYELGQLGHVMWFRCPACGMDWYHELPSPNGLDMYTTNSVTE